MNHLYSNAYMNDANCIRTIESDCVALNWRLFFTNELCPLVSFVDRSFVLTARINQCSCISECQNEKSWFPCKHIYERWTAYCVSNGEKNMDVHVDIQEERLIRNCQNIHWRNTCVSKTRHIFCRWFVIRSSNIIHKIPFFYWLRSRYMSLWQFGN